jgi:hypothetical protein
MEKKGLEYDSIYKVPRALEEKHEISMREITGNPKHANDMLIGIEMRRWNISSVYGDRRSEKW